MPAWLLAGACATVCAPFDSGLAVSGENDPEHAQAAIGADRTQGLGEAGNPPPWPPLDEAFGLETAEMDALAAEAALRRGQWNRARDLAAKAYEGGSRQHSVVGIYTVAALLLNDKEAVMPELPEWQSQPVEAYYRGLAVAITALRDAELASADEQLEVLLSSHPDDALLLFFSGQSAMIRGNHPKALELFRLALRNNPEFAPAMGSIARLLPSDQGREAIALMQRALALHPENGAYRRHLAGLYRQAGEEGQARQLFKELLGVIPDVRQRYLSLARKRLLSGADLAALEQVENTFRLWGIEADGYLIKAMAAIDLGRLEGVKEVIDAYLEANSRDHNAYFAAGLCYLALGWLPEARFAFQASAELRPNFVQALTNLVVVDQAEGRLEQANKRLREVRAVSPPAHAGLLGFIDANLRLAAGNLPGYRRSLAGVSGLLPGAEELRLILPSLNREQQRALALDHNLMLLMFLNRWDAQVIRYADLALQLFEANPVARYFRGLALEAQGKPGLARQDFQAAVKQEPRFVGAVMGLARVRQQMGDPGGAIEIYRSILAIDPEFEPAHLGLIAALLAMGRELEARKALAEAVAIARQGRTQFLLAQAYGRVGDEETAGVLLKKALGSGDPGPWREQAAELLARYERGSAAQRLR